MVSPKAMFVGLLLATMPAVLLGWLAMDPSPTVETILNDASVDCVPCRQLVFQVDSALSNVSRDKLQALRQAARSDSVALDRLLEQACAAAAAPRSKGAPTRKDKKDIGSGADCSALVRTRKASLASYVNSWRPFAGGTSKAAAAQMLRFADCPVLPAPFASGDHNRTSNRTSDWRCAHAQRFFVAEGTGPVCFPYCEERLRWYDRSLVFLLRLAADPRIRSACATIRELAGTVVVFGGQCGLLFSILQLRLKHRSLNQRIFSSVRINKGAPSFSEPHKPAHSSTAATVVPSTSKRK